MLKNRQKDAKRLWWMIPLLQDTANATLRSETLWRNCVRCIDYKWGCKKPVKRCKTFAMAEPSNTVQILVACAMQDTRLIHSNCLRGGRTTETGSHNNVCAMQDTRLINLNGLRWGRTTKAGIHINVCAIYGIRLTRTNYFRLGNTTETVQLNKMCVICDIRFT